MIQWVAVITKERSLFVALFLMVMNKLQVTSITEFMPM